MKILLIICLSYILPLFISRWLTKYYYRDCPNRKLDEWNLYMCITPFCNIIYTMGYIMAIVDDIICDKHRIEEFLKIGGSK